MSKTVEVTLNTGEKVRVYGYTNARNGILCVVETYGDGQGTKEVVNYPLTSVRSWTEK